jgi:UV excision repair protein RAD23
MAQQQHQQRGAGMAGAGGGLGGAGGLAGLGGLGGLGGARGLGGLGGAGGGAGAGLGGGPGAPTPEALAGVRQAIAQNPALLQQAIQQVLAENPALAQQVSQNPELLYQMFAGAGGDDDEEGGDYGGMGHMQPQTIALTPDEMAAIERVSLVVLLEYLLGLNNDPHLYI